MKEVFDAIDRRYDFLNHLFSLCLDYYWRNVMVRELLPLNGRVVLDLATGTGDSARRLVEKGFLVVGVDLSGNMLCRARRKIPQSNFIPLCGSAYALPFAEGTFDGVTCAFGIRNMHETPAALAEIFRVMKRGGKVVFLEFSMPRGWIRRPYALYLRAVIPAIAGVISRREAYEYLGESICGFHPPEEFCRLIAEAGFHECEKKPLSMGLVHLHSGVKG
jgi:demethylmenaquinone methyltransferase/2-methoxy-6-polyprenyl-1,4-benzoquinol methylase